MTEINVIKVFEDRQQKVELTIQNMKDLFEMKNIIGGNNIIIQADGTLLIRHYVGFIQLNKTRLLVYPKISIGLDVEEEYEKSFEILTKMLMHSGFLSVKKIPEAQNITKFQNDLMELYISIFADELKVQFQRDINRGYNNQLENQSFIKGKVDFNETIKHNSFKKHLHYVRYDEFNENTLINRIFKTVIQILIVKTKVKQNKIKLKQILLWLEDVSELRIDKDIWNKVIFTRQNKKYKSAFNMAKLFYYNSSPIIKDGNISALSFLIPVNQVFEMYLFKLLDENGMSDYQIKFQGPIDYLAEKEGKKFLKMKPDITLIKNAKVSKVIDAKYKIITDIDEKILVAQGDVYQMLAYSVRYQCDDIYLIYPKSLADSQDGIITSFTISNYDKTVKIRIIKVDLEDDPKIVGKKLIKLVDRVEE